MSALAREIKQRCLEDLRERPFANEEIDRAFVDGVVAFVEENKLMLLYLARIGYATKQTESA